MKASRKTVLTFLRVLADLLESGLAVRQALGAVAASGRHSRCAQLAQSVLQSVLEGYALSSALKHNTVTAVDERTVSVIKAAEKTGNVVPALRFIIGTEEKREETEARLAEVALYPALVLCIAAAGSGVLISRYRLFAFDAPPAGALEACVHAGLFLVLFLLLFCVAYYRIFKTDAGQIFFYETDFLLSSGLCVTDALHIISGFSESRTALIAERMLPDIRAGVSFAEVFVKAYGKPPASETTLLLELAQTDGDLAGACRAVWKQLGKRADRRKQVALRLAEPVLLTGTGLCLLILLEGAVLPFLTQFGGVI